MKINNLIANIEAIFVRVPEDFVVAGIEDDSRAVSEGFVFVAVKGNLVDGHDYIKQAIVQGAKGVIFEDNAALSQIPDNRAAIKVKDSRKALAEIATLFYKEPAKKLKSTAITGTNGKTTVSYLIEGILKNAGKKPGIIGTVNMRFNDTIISTQNTTPGQLTLQRVMARMVEAGVEYLVMEVSSHALAQGRIEGIDFYSAIFTNFTQDHLDYHKDMESYFKAKAVLFEGLSKNSFAILNADDPVSVKLAALTKAKVITYAVNAKADVSCQDLVFSSTSTEFTLHFRGESLLLKTKLIGRYNVSNILAASAWALVSGIAPKILAQAVESFKTVPGRLQSIELGNDFGIFVDFAHTDDALANVLSTLREITLRRLIVVFGCGGDRDKLKRPKMGRVATDLADYVIITNDNPRSESSEAIASDITGGILLKNYKVILDRRKAIQEALAMAEKGDILLIAGKGHESYQVIGKDKIDFNDSQVVKECLASAKS